MSSETPMPASLPLLPEDARLNADQRQKLARLGDIIAELGHVLVTFSGGVDSALVVRVAHQVLGDQAIALTAVSATFPPEELAESQRVAGELGVTQVLVQSHELQSEGYAANAGDRCYFCKSELFELARAAATERGIPWILDGTITDDLGDHRPGLVAAEQASVRHPLVEAGFDKLTVRAVSRALGLPVWDKPAFACLGSRFPVGTRVTAARVRQVQRVESVLRTFGLRQLRARWHELEGLPLLRLELAPSEMGALANDELRRAVTEVAKAEGFAWVTLDLEGYTRGRLSHALGPVKTTSTASTES